MLKQIDQNNFAEFINVFIEAGGTIETLAKSIYKPMKKPHYNVRLYNTREDVASHTGLFNNIPIDINAIRKAITTISHLGNSLVDYEKGCNVRTGSKKSEWYIYQKDIPTEVFKLIPTDTVEAFGEVDV